MLFEPNFLKWKGKTAILEEYSYVWFKSNNNDLNLKINFFDFLERKIRFFFQRWLNKTIGIK